MNSSATTLLAYASLYGSTQEVAQAIAEELRAAGLDTEMASTQDVASLENYAAVVLGGGIYNAKWHPEAHQFIKRHQTVLKGRPLAVFALGPLSTDAPAMARSRRQLQAELALYPWLRPFAVEVFVGTVDPSKLGLFDRIGLRASDHRDWQAIRAWARSLSAQLQQSPIPATAA